MVAALDLANTLRARSAERRARADVRAARLRAQLEPAARILRDSFGASHVFLFGSLADGTFSEASDVDLAVADLPRARYFEALAELMRLFGVRVDLVRIEDAPSSLRDCILQEGQPL